MVVARTPFTRSLVFAVLVIATACAAAACAPRPTSAPSVDATSGALLLQVQGGTTSLDSVAYDIERPGGPSRMGWIDVSHSAQVSTVVGALPAGGGYTITLSGTAADGVTTCTGSGSFTVTAGATAMVSVGITCHEGARAGSVLVSGTLNVCPVIDGVGASPAEVTVGSALVLSATAHDSDTGPAALAYQWSANGGTLSSATSASPSFTCTAPGTFTVTLGVSDGDPAPGCADTQTVTVTCDAGFALTASPSDLGPGQPATLKVIATDGSAHPQATYTWWDGLGALQTGLFAAGVVSSSPNATYTPAACNALGGGDHALTVSVSILDPMLAGAGTATALVTVHCPASFYTTKTPYQPFADPAAASAPPAGFSPVFTELVARHGSRGLSSLKYDAATLAMWNRAQADGALTALGAQLGPDVQKIMRANALLGYQVPGISNVGYGNLTQVGINEQKQLAVRLLQRLPGFFAQLAMGTGPLARQIVLVSSGMDRAVDSDAFFAGSLAATSPGLGGLLTQAPALTAYPANAPVAQPAGVNHFLLYFHKLSKAADLVTNATDPYFQTYQDSLAYQAYASDAQMTAKVAAVLSDPTVKMAARAILEGLFDKTFVDKIDNGTYTFANTGSFTFTTDDGLFTTSLTGDGKTKVQSLADAASMLYNLYIIVPAMVSELGGMDFTKYIPTAQAQVLAYLQDAQDFYQLGPSITEKAPVTYKMAQKLQDDFFTEIDAIAGGDLSHAAKLRFTHAEIIVPFANIMGFDGAATTAPLASTYTYANNPWRGQLVASMAANQQWDVFRDGSGKLLVRLLYNEKEVDLKAACDGARYAPGSRFYEYGALKACYGR